MAHKPTKTLDYRLELKAVEDDGTFTGYASTFETVDQGGDVVKRGAFAKSLTTRPATKIKMLRDHDPAQPVGVWTSVSEDRNGLLAKGRLILDTVLGRETHALMKAGALDGLSIGYRVFKDHFDRNKGVRYLQSLDLREISITAFPMNEAAVITAVKNSGEAEARRIVEAINRARGVLQKA